MVGLKRHCTDFSVFVLFHGNTQQSAAPELRRLFEGGAYLLFLFTCAALYRGRRFFWGGAYWSKYGNLHRKHAELLLNVLSNNSVIDGYMTTGRPGALLICISRFKQTNTYLLLAECEVRTASYGPSFSLPFMVQARSAWAMKTTKEITRIHNLPYGPSKQG